MSLSNQEILDAIAAKSVMDIVELVKMGELAVRLKRHTGRFTSKRFGFAPPSGEYLERVRAFYGPDVYPGAG